MIKIAKILATAGGAGYSPVAPGTAGALVGALVLFLLGSYCDWDCYNLSIVVATVIFTLLGVWATNVLEKEWGHDPGKIVIDEVVGIWLSALFIPFSLTNIALAFVLFRIFDIWKPLFIKSAEKWPRGWGVMGDDLIAGLVANLVLQIILHFL